jgi:hypothetical protein
MEEETHIKLINEGFDGGLVARKETWCRHKSELCAERDWI